MQPKMMGPSQNEGTEIRDSERLSPCTMTIPTRVSDKKRRGENMALAKNEKQKRELLKKHQSTKALAHAWRYRAY
jgi:hypothetical protein